MMTTPLSRNPIALSVLLAALAGACVDDEGNEYGQATAELMPEEPICAHCNVSSTNNLTPLVAFEGADFFELHSTEEGGSEWDVVMQVVEDASGLEYEMAIEAESAASGETSFYDAQGEITCWYEGGTLYDWITGAAVYEVDDGAVFVPGAREPSVSFSETLIFRGDDRTGTPVLELSSGPALSSDRQRIVVAALVEGVCLVE